MLSDVAAIATAIGVALVAVPLGYARRQTRTALEDDLSRKYREIVLKLPVEAFFDPRDDGRTPAPPPFEESLSDYLRYIDLTNQQIFLRAQRRISARTWKLWRDGIRDNLGRPAFGDAWAHVCECAWRSYDELWSVTQDWTTDPAWWEPPSWHLLGRVRAHRQGPRRSPDARQAGVEAASAPGALAAQ